MFSQESMLLEQKYLELLAVNYPTIQTASTEIINLTAILNLPKGTEHFISDLHGEYDVFAHILKSASGSIKRKINSCFEDTISQEEKDLLATLIYYPQEKLADLQSKGICDDEWYKAILIKLALLCRVATSKYTRSKVRKKLPKDFRYIIEELMYTDNFEMNKHEYFDKILDTIIEIGRADNFIIELSTLLQNIIVDKLHIIGDIFDRGTGADLIMEDLCQFHDVDIQWGNHDVVWMAAANGHLASIANVVRNSIRYNNFHSLEEAYGINIRPLAVFAMEQYRDDDCEGFIAKVEDEYKTNKIDLSNFEQAKKLHKAITIIQLKLEGQIIKKRTEFKMEDRLQLGAIDYETKSIEIDGKKYEVKDVNLPTVDKNDPYKLTDDEQMVMEQLKLSFLHSKLLKKHVNFLYQKGGIYRIYNNNLMYHGCIPMDKDGSFLSFYLDGNEYSGKSFLDLCDKICRLGAYSKGSDKEFGLDFMWYLWCGGNSPLNGKTKMTTFERAFIDDESTWNEPKDEYYKFIESRTTAEMILREFGVFARNSHIVNGHVPIKIVKGESPIKAGGKLLIIDGGISKVYQKVTGIAGYTLVSNSYQLLLSEHHPFKSVDEVIKNNDDMHSKYIPVDTYKNRMIINDTDRGVKIGKKINELKMLVQAYRTGLIKER